jgi:YD repeat-containing protein
MRARRRRQAIRDRHGNEIRLTWSPLNQLQRVTSPNGRWIAFTYGTGGRVSQASDNIGRTVPESHKGQVYKSTDGIDLTIDKGGSVSASGGPIDWSINFVRGGWKDKAWLAGLQKAGDRGWDALFAASDTKPQCQKKMACSQ